MLVCTGSSCRHREGRMCVSEVTCADDEKEKGHAGRHTEGDLRAACRAGKKRTDHLALRNARMKASHEGFTTYTGQRSTHSCWALKAAGLFAS